MEDERTIESEKTPETDLVSLAPGESEDEKPTPHAAGAMRPAWARWLAALGIVAGLALAWLAWRARGASSIFSDPEQIVAAVRNAGALGGLLIIGLQAAQVVIAPIPGQIVNLMAGYVFGLGRGVLYSWLGSMLGTVIALALARFAGRPLVTRLVSPQVLARLDQLAAKRGLAFFFLVYLLPLLPDDAACFAAGLTPLPISALLIVAAVGRLPTIVVAVWVGANAGQLPWYGWAVIGGLGVALIGLLWAFGGRIQDTLLKLAARGGG